MNNLKKRLICHRANICGADKARENKIDAIKECIKLGYDVEIDITFYKNKFYLGHDERQEVVDIKFLKKWKNRLWIHCKDLASLHNMTKNKLNYFWHQNDDYTLTSKNIIWTYPNKKVTDKCVIVCQNLKETKKYIKSNAFKICTDYVQFL